MGFWPEDQWDYTDEELNNTHNKTKVSSTSKYCKTKMNEKIEEFFGIVHLKTVVYFCKHCGCTWRDNKDGTMSLYGHNSKSCDICENSSLDKLTPLYRD